MRQDKKASFWSKKETILGGLGIILTIGLGFLAIYFSRDLKNLDRISNYGLAGVFLFPRSMAERIRKPRHLEKAMAHTKALHRERAPR